MPSLPFKKSNSSSTKSSGIFSFILQFGVVAILFFAIGFSLGQKKIQIDKNNFTPSITVENKLPASQQTVDFSLFWKVFDSIPKTYYDKSAIDGQKLMYGAISGMVRSLGDPYTTFLDPKQNNQIKDELAGSYEGIGIEIGFNKDKRLAVISPLSGSPAQKAGIMPKDLVLKIGEKETIDLTLPEAVELIRGEAGTRIALTLLHDGENEPYSVDINRAQITVKSVELSYETGKSGKKVAIVKVTRFGDTTDSEWDDAVNQVQLEGAGGVVVDMRNNPGGLLTSAIHLASEFVQGTVVKQDFANGNVESIPSDHKGELLNIPVVVLVNGGSASASEIFAGAIADSKRGKIVGEQTFGKGTVQDAVDLPGGSGLHVTVAKWLTPKGTWVHNEGLKPDVEVPLTKEDIEAARDPQKEKALELL